ncbi:MAG: hypothetical protein V1788_01240 [Nanoarchaeota archaeon]|nr:hypothetical protein [Nanoarchaeota archaeon]
MGDSNLTSRTITGGVMIILGLVLMITAFFTSLFILVYGLIALVLGLFIFFNKKEDDIEVIKTEKKSKISTYLNKRNSNERGKRKK